MTAVAPPDLLPDSPGLLGALAPALRRLAELQGHWPPTRPVAARTLPVPGAPSYATGAAAADAAADEGVDLLLVDTDDDAGAALAALSVLLEIEPVAAIGTAGGPGWTALLGAVRGALPGLRPLVGDPAALLAATGAPALAHLTGAVEQAARRRTPVLLGSGPAAVAAALLADRRAPGAGRWLLAGSSGASPATVRALSALGVAPVLDLRLPGAGGAVLADRVLRAALDLLDA